MIAQFAPKRRGPKPVEPDRRASDVLRARITPTERRRLELVKQVECIETDAELVREALDEYCARRERHRAA
jgi:hypothetical protein